MTERKLARAYLVDQDDAHEEVVNTIPAQPGYYLLEANRSWDDAPWSYDRFNIIAWNVTRGGWLSPLTLNAETNDAMNQHWVQFPDGRVECGQMLEQYDNLEAWVEDMRKQDAERSAAKLESVIG